MPSEPPVKAETLESQIGARRLQTAELDAPCYMKSGSLQHIRDLYKIYQIISILIFYFFRSLYKKIMIK